MFRKIQEHMAVVTWSLIAIAIILFSAIYANNITRNYEILKIDGGKFDTNNIECIEGVAYVYSGGLFFGGYSPLIDKDGNPVPCVRKTKNTLQKN